MATSMAAMPHHILLFQNSGMQHSTHRGPSHYIYKPFRLLCINMVSSQNTVRQVAAHWLGTKPGVLSEMTWHELGS